ncbi:MAG: hypothetical protein GYB33_14430 [Gammaproteobacteria bacterium]|nr:hypothetical protein [Gammaproteobacteria bacterium]
MVGATRAFSAVIFGVYLYAFFLFMWAPLHNIHMMFVTLLSCVATALLVSRFVFGKQASLAIGRNAEPHLV